MAFSSGRHQKLTVDHEPWRFVFDESARTSNAERLPDGGYVNDWRSVIFDPRTEFDRPLHNPGNRILKEFRRTTMRYRTVNADFYIDYIDNGDVHDWRDLTHEEHRHAREVLTRYSRVVGKSSEAA
ncbi:hypothetical protein ACFVAJ_18850 [Agromyces sp. NPDC057679]|uniref:hypothetical protein n=1 Tax=Agromyces sp. NPDC057679 TaxID=3346207 RepID=UPI00366C386C